ncbi:MAG: hypothetical protein ACOY35_07690, partial [Bacillota bacterium]
FDLTKFASIICCLVFKDQDSSLDKLRLASSASSFVSSRIPDTLRALTRRFLAMLASREPNNFLF